jgi:hypothetical protein
MVTNVSRELGREGRYRAHRRLDPIARKLGSDTGHAALLPRPKGIHRSTYARLGDAYFATEGVIDLLSPRRGVPSADRLAPGRRPATPERARTIECRAHARRGGRRAK